MLQQFSRAELERMTNGPSWQTGNAKAMLAKLDRGEKLAMTYEAPVAVWQFGSDLTLVGLSGEVVVDYVSLIEQAIGPLQLWVSAYCNDVFGYFPSARVLKEGGYECRGLYTTQGFFAPAAQDVLVTRVRELAQRAGRKLPESAAAHLRKPPAELGKFFAPPEQHRSDFGNFRSPLVFADGTRVRAVLAGASQRLWLLTLDDACNSSRVLGVLSSLALRRRDAAILGNLLAKISKPRRRRYVVSAASGLTVAGHAGADRLQRTVPPVCSGCIHDKQLVPVADAKHGDDAFVLVLSNVFAHCADGLADRAG